MIPYLDLKRENNFLKENLISSFSTSVSSGNYILSDEVKLFEEQFSLYCGVRGVAGVASGLDALALILAAYNIGNGDDVILAANGYIATAIAVSRAGASPIFCDVDESSYNICPSKILEKITPNTKAVIVTHLYGNSCEMERISDICKTHNLVLIEDAAQAHGATYRDQKCGGLSNAAAFSFYPTKNLGCLGDGGCIVSNNDELISKIKILRNYGSEKKYYNHYIGFNSRLDSIQASFLSLKIAYLDDWTEKRRSIASTYLNTIKNNAIGLPKFSSENNPCWHVFPVRVKNRDSFLVHLEKQGIGFNIHYPVPIHLQECYAYLGHKRGDFPISERLCNEEVSIPLNPFLTHSEIDTIIDVLNTWMG